MKLLLTIILLIILLFSSTFMFEILHQTLLQIKQHKESTETTQGKQESKLL